MTFKIIKRDSRHIFERFNATIDVCKFMKDRSNPLANILFNSFADYTNVNHTCPINVRMFLVFFLIKLKAFFVSSTTLYWKNCQFSM